MGAVNEVNESGDEENVDQMNASNAKEKDGDL